MANQQDIDRTAKMVRLAIEKRNLADAKSALTELADLEKTFDSMLGKVSAPTQRQMVEDLKVNAHSCLEDLGPRVDALELDQMDPNYEQRTRRREEMDRAAKEAERSKAAEVLKGLGGPFAALAGLAGLGQSAPAPSAPAAADASPETVSCPKCQAPNAKLAKFCSECGNPLAHKCSSCGADLGKAKFCPECGAKAG